VALRGAGDRAAVRALFHEPASHGAFRPPEPVAARLFDALAAARLDVLGAQWMPGVAVNLMADYGPRPLALQWLAFALFTELELPLELTGDVERLRAVVSPELLAALSALRPALELAPEFARRSAAWAHAAVSSAWCTAALTGIDAPLQREEAGPPGSSSAAGSDVASAADARDGANDRPTEFSALSPKRPATTADASRSDSPSTDGDSSTADYAAYTTAYDRIIDAAALAEPDELAQLRARLDSELGETRRAVTRLANRLRRTLLARQLRHWEFDLDEGVVDGSRIARVISSPSDARSFKRETDSPFPTAALTLLIDHSGSMRGRPILIAALTAEILALALERCGIRCEILGFTTRDWNDGRVVQEWMANGLPAAPGRLNALEHIVLKSADVPWRRARRGLGLVLRDELLKENIDGEAVQWAHARLVARPERRRILLVVSDGEPRDEATAQANGGRYLARHLRAVVEDIECHSRVHIAAIGVGHDVLRFYSNAMTIATADDLGRALNETLVPLLAGSAVKQ
jgi:cobaltochelatase CobT